MGLRPTLFDVWVHRKIDDQRLAFFYERVDAAEVIAIRTEHQCAPGEISTWLVLASPRPWDGDHSAKADAPR